jgi:hypothetical protein
LRHLVAEAGVSQIVYGTDYPFDWPVGIDFVLNAKFLSNADKEAILRRQCDEAAANHLGATHSSSRQGQTEGRVPIRGSAPRADVSYRRLPKAGCRGSIVRPPEADEVLQRTVSSI